tara:strand:- start:326 stop:886 length:561 start_codon:yes stop_codon:yes gene_type:complete
MTLLNIMFYVAPLAGIVLFFCGYHVGRSIRTKDHANCVTEVGRLYDEIRYLRKEAGDQELERREFWQGMMNKQHRIEALEEELSRKEFEIKLLKKRLELEEACSASKGFAMTELEGESDDLRLQVQALSDQLQELFESLHQSETEVGSLKGKLKEKDLRISKMVRAHMALPGGNKIYLGSLGRANK